LIGNGEKPCCSRGLQRIWSGAHASRGQAYQLL
jgi:hypothetical protein